MSCRERSGVLSQFSFEAICGMLSLHEQQGIMRENDPNLAKTSWLFRAFGERGLDRLTGTIR